MSPLPDSPFEIGLREKLIGRTRGDLAAMRTAVEAGDFPTIVRLAHRLVGAAGALGLDALDAHARALQHDGERHDGAAARARLMALDDELARASGRSR